MRRFVTIFAAAAALGACAMAPDRAEPGWADAVLAESPPGATPATVPDEVLDPDLRRDLRESALVVQQRGGVVRGIGIRLQAPTVDTAEFLVEARERARPPDPR